jgi:hypothetical protein
MKTGKWIGWTLAVAILPVWAACSRDVGECWLPSEDGQGAAGGGPIVPVGTGGFGDAPPKPKPQDASNPPPDCNPGNATDDSCTLADVRCISRQDWGKSCQFQCGTQSKYCDAQITHTLTKKPVLLYQCTGCKEDPRCWYANPDKPTDVCIDRPNRPYKSNYPVCLE